SSALPRSRTIPSRPFDHVGIDLAGPFSVRADDTIAKQWVCLVSYLDEKSLPSKQINALRIGPMTHSTFSCAKDKLSGNLLQPLHPRKGGWWVSSKCACGKTLANKL
ncbi:unnamed protein product, partial [Heligmosomoides polygyrus]|uniref:MOSC_N domain-containing protein n=1 Tax=Heligmosomoides polygyrus TaxID=6339 RepID=A0A183FCP8_HELPZ